jgi:hypothetical protein
MQISSISVTLLELFSISRKDQLVGRDIMIPILGYHSSNHIFLNYTRNVSLRNKVKKKPVHYMFGYNSSFGPANNQLSLSFN